MLANMCCYLFFLMAMMAAAAVEGFLDICLYFFLLDCSYGLILSLAKCNILDFINNFKSNYLEFTLSFISIPKLSYSQLDQRWYYLPRVFEAVYVHYHFKQKTPNHEVVDSYQTIQTNQYVNDNIKEVYYIKHLQYANLESDQKLLNVNVVYPNITWHSYLNLAPYS